MTPGKPGASGKATSKAGKAAPAKAKPKARKAAPSPAKPTTAGPATPKPTTAKLPYEDQAADVDARLVAAPPRDPDLVQAMRAGIRASAPGLCEQWKWNAPSFSARDHIVTFNLRVPEGVMLVFHHPGVVEVASPLLEGDYPDRRICTIRDTADWNAKRAEVGRIVAALAAM